MSRRHLRVVAALITENGRILLTQRPVESHMGGLWEFPGGKVEEGEGDVPALVREIREELGIAIAVEELYCNLQFAYPEFDLDFHVFRCRTLGGTMRPLEVAAIGWFTPAELADLPLPPADRPVVERLQAEAGIVPKG